MCLPCPAGTNNYAGDDIMGEDTTCDVTYCAQNEYVASNMCLECPAGTTNPPGDNASGPDTSCATLLCEDESACNSGDYGDCIYPENNFDCNGNCTVEVDCAGTCGGTAVNDDCGVCDDNSTNDCVQDCAGEWGGTAEFDECGVCDGDGADCNNDGIDDVCEDEYDAGFAEGFLEGQSTGDVNNDGQVNVTDVVTIVQLIILGWSEEE